MISDLLNYEKIVFIMTKITDASIKLCKDWKNISGRKNKRVLKQKYGGSESTWGKIMYFSFVSLSSPIDFEKSNQNVLASS